MGEVAFKNFLRALPKGTDARSTVTKWAYPAAKGKAAAGRERGGVAAGGALGGGKGGAIGRATGDSPTSTSTHKQTIGRKLQQDDVQR